MQALLQSASSTSACQPRPSVATAPVRFGATGCAAAAATPISMPNVSIPAPRARPAPRRPPLLFDAAIASSTTAMDYTGMGMLSGYAKGKQPPPPPQAQLQSQRQPGKNRQARQLRSVGEGAALEASASNAHRPGHGWAEQDSLAKMEAVLSGYRDLKDFRQRARAALLTATAEHEAFAGDRTGSSWRHCACRLSHPISHSANSE